jgi:GntR family transcriptional regulator, rspAB operon transcriptional repressor
VSERTEPRRENLYLRLREDILSCALAPGQDLHESELAARFAVSKSPIRDALMRLEADRLVTVQARKGYRVAPISLTDAADLFDLRAVLEVATAKGVAQSASDADIAKLDRFRSLESWGKSWGKEIDFVAYNREFHLGVAKLCPNLRISATAKDVIEQFDRLVRLDVTTSRPSDARSMITDHNQIIDALQARDDRKAARLVNQHIERAKRRLIGSLERARIVP